MSAFVDLIAEAKASRNFQGLVDNIPYHAYLGIRVHEENGALIAVLPGNEKIIGNPALPAIHGGVIGAFLETTAILHLMWSGQTLHVPKTITVTVDYMRSAAVIDTYAKATITKLGSRVANVRARAWQDDPERPVAAVNANFLIQPADSG
ncbi:MAG TPA: PaaI family thioesterase [Alphaproteobacteria bacterium]|nr:PaaI family thioesterase [Alphaproteobacteria bacterium]